MFSNKKIAALVISLAIYGLAHFGPFSHSVAALERSSSQEVVAGSNLATQFSACKDYFPNSQPAVPDNVRDQSRELCFDDFAVLYSSKTKTPVYAVEKLNRARLEAAKGEQRTNKFYEEARLPRAERSTLSDYHQANLSKDCREYNICYDRGHNAPAGDRSTDEAMAQSFSLANMFPQISEHNRKTWSDIEKATRKYVMRARGDVFVFTGPYYDPAKEPNFIGNGVRVPDVIWKLVFDSSNGKMFVYWSRNASGEHVEAPISYDDFVSRTGMDLIKKT